MSVIIWTEQNWHEGETWSVAFEEPQDNGELFALLEKACEHAPLRVRRSDEPIEAFNELEKLHSDSAGYYPRWQVCAAPSVSQVKEALAREWPYEHLYKLGLWS